MLTSRWAALLVMGVLFCVLAYIVMAHGYSLRVASSIVDVEMSPGNQQVGAGTASNP